MGRSTLESSLSPSRVRSPVLYSAQTMSPPGTSRSMQSTAELSRPPALPRTSNTSATAPWPVRSFTALLNWVMVVESNWVILM